MIETMKTGDVALYTSDDGQTSIEVLVVQRRSRPIIDNAALAGLTLMIALSKPEEKDTMCALVMNCLTHRATQ